MPAYRSKEASVEGMHRNLLSSVWQRKYNIVNFIIQATGQPEFFWPARDSFWVDWRPFWLRPWWRLNFFWQKKNQNWTSFFAALPSSHFPETKSTKKEKEKRKMRLYFESFCRLSFFIIKSNQFSFLDVYIFIPTVLWRRNFVLFWYRSTLLASFWSTTCKLDICKPICVYWACLSCTAWHHFDLKSVMLIILESLFKGHSDKKLKKRICRLWTHDH